MSWTRLRGLSGQERIDATVAFAHRIVDEQGLVCAHRLRVFPVLHLGDYRLRLRPAGRRLLVDLLSLCVKAGAGGAPAPSPSANP